MEFKTRLHLLLNMYFVLATKNLNSNHALHFDIFIHYRGHLTSHHITLPAGKKIIQTPRNPVRREIVLKTTRPRYFLNLYNNLSSIFLYERKQHQLKVKHQVLFH